jgi:hypothetical protein
MLLEINSLPQNFKSLDYDKLQPTRKEVTQETRQFYPQSISNNPLQNFTKPDYLREYRNSDAQHAPNLAENVKAPNPNERKQPGRISAAKAFETGIGINFEDPTNLEGNKKRTMDLIERMNQTMPVNSTVMFSYIDYPGINGEKCRGIKLINKNTLKYVPIPKKYITAIQLKVDNALQYLDTNKSQVQSPPQTNSVSEQNPESLAPNHLVIKQMKAYPTGIGISFYSGKSETEMDYEVETKVETLNRDLPVESKFEYKSFKYHRDGKLNRYIGLIRKSTCERVTFTDSQSGKIQIKLDKINNGDLEQN